MSHAKTKVKILLHAGLAEVYLRSSFLKDTRVKIASGENTKLALNAAIKELEDRIAEINELKYREGL